MSPHSQQSNQGRHKYRVERAGMSKQSLTTAWLAIACATLAGCGLGGRSTSPTGTPVSGTALQGTAFGGQQPVKGATIQLYAASAAGYGSSATPLLHTAVITDASGYFSITGDYTCPSSTTPVYLLATGGDSGSGVSPNLSMMAGIGACGTLTSSSFVSVNELTTVASVWALAPFMTSSTGLATSGTNAGGLLDAFADEAALVDIAHGSLPGLTLPANATIPKQEINTLGDVLAACVNSSGGVAGDASPCGVLFAAATPPSGTAPTDVVTAALNIAHHPGVKVADAYSLVSASGPFQPTLPSQPNDWTIGISYSDDGIAGPTAIAVDAADHVWVTNGVGNSFTELNHVGAVASSGNPGNALNAPSSAVIDAGGGAWLTNRGNNTLTYLTSAGVFGITAAGGGLSGPTGISIDNLGYVWVANGDGNVLSQFSASGASTLSSSGFTGPGLARPLAIAVSPR